MRSGPATAARAVSSKTPANLAEKAHSSCAQYYWSSQHRGWKCGIGVVGIIAVVRANGRMNTANW